MATKKPAPKKAAPARKAPAKPAPKKAASKPAPARKTAPAKKAAKPAAKKVAAKPAPKKAAPVKKVVSKPAPKKPVAKSVPKKAAAKPAPKKVVVTKPAPAKVAGKPAAKPVAKPAPAPAVKPVPKPIQAPILKKPEVKAPPAPPVKPVRKPLEPIKDVKVPKTSVKTSVPYHPGYTPLEKRVDTAKNTDPLVRYSDADLNEFRELINRKLEAAKKELAYLQGLITRKDEMGGDNDDARYMTMEDGSMSMEREQLSQMASRQITYIDHLEKALMRIENKTYGICRVTGRLIDKARLRAVPHATLSLEAKLGLVKPATE
jgi:RNA polymerase-binding transcription factor DksA